MGRGETNKKFNTYIISKFAKKKVGWGFSDSMIVRTSPKLYTTLLVREDSQTRAVVFQTLKRNFSADMQLHLNLHDANSRRRNFRAVMQMQLFNRADTQ